MRFGLRVIAAGLLAPSLLLTVPGQVPSPATSRPRRVSMANLQVPAPSNIAPAGAPAVIERVGATSAPAAPVATDDDVELNSDLVLVSAVVTTNANGNDLVRGLTSHDFSIFDEGVRQEISFFGDESLPLEVVFLVDASQSMQLRRSFQREALSTFMHTLLRPTDHAAVYWFSDKLHVMQDFTSQSGSLVSAIYMIPSGGATALYSAIASSSSALASKSGRRAIVVLSDGRDTFSGIRLEDALRQAQSTDTAIYAINTSFARWAVTEEYRENDPLEYLANETGGEVYYISNPDDVEDALSRLSGRLREQYLLGFYPSSQNARGKYRRLSIRLNGRDGHVFARTGYYAR
jgi:Ca-activated chloride channel family protein